MTINNAKCKEATYDNGYISLTSNAYTWGEMVEAMNYNADMHGDEVIAVEHQESLMGWGEYTKLVKVSYRDAAPSYFAVAV